MELNIGDKFVGIISGTIYKYVGFKKNTIVLRDMSTELVHDVTEKALEEYYRPYKKVKRVTVSVPVQSYGMDLINCDFGSLEKRVIANMVRAQQMLHQRRLWKHLYSTQVQFSISKDLGLDAFNLAHFLIPPVKKEQNSGTVTGRVYGTVTHEAKGNKSDGSSADYYKLPDKATQLQDLISHKDMNAQMGEIFRAAYRYGQASHSDKLRDAKKIEYYIKAEIKRLESL